MHQASPSNVPFGRIDKVNRERLVARAVQDAMVSVPPIDVPVDGDVPDWGASHAKEQQFQEDKLKSRWVKAFRAGALLDREVDDDLLAGAAALAALAEAEEKRAQDRAKLAGKKSRKAAVMPSALQLSGKTVFV